MISLPSRREKNLMRVKEAEVSKKPVPKKRGRPKKKVVEEQPKKEVVEEQSTE